MHKKPILLLALGLLISSGAVGAYQVAAQNNAANNKAAVQREVQEPSYHGSIKVDDTKYEGKSEQGESKALAGLAKITTDQAKQAAEAKIGGNASGVELGNENGTLVYEVKIGKQEVKVDAGAGSVLKVEQDGNEKEGKKEGIESKKEKKTEKDSDIEKDGIDHQFEGQEEHTD